jgi:hypothetical protein
MTGPGGGASFTTNVGAASSTLTLTPVRLTSFLNFAENQQVSGSLASTSVNVSTSSASVGTVASPVTFAGGDSSAITPFTPNTTGSTGSTTLTAVAPSGFSTPASGNIVTATVNPPTLVPSNVTVGMNLETTAHVTGASSGLQLTVTSNNASLLLFSATPTGAGSASIMVNVPGGQTTSPDFYVYGLGNSGGVTYTVTASGFAPATGTVTLMPSGFVIAKPGGVAPNASFTAFSANTNINVFAALLDSSLNYVANQPLAGGMSANVNVTSSNTSVGTISSSPVTIAGGTIGATTQFMRGNTGGSSDLTVNTPTGFSTPTAPYTKVTANVASQSFFLSCDGMAIGLNLESSCNVTIGQPAPADVLVTLTSNNPSLVLLSATPAAAGATSITVTIPTGSTTSATYYAQALSASGSPTHTASAPAFASRTATATLAPSGVVIAGPNGLGAPFFNATVSGGPVPVTVYLAVLNPGSSSFSGTTQALRGGLASLPVTVSSSITSVGTIASPVTITSGSDHAVTQFTPVSQGQTTVSVATPGPPYIAASNNTSLAASISP